MITKPKFDESVFVCPGAAIVGDVTLGKNVNVWYNAVLRGDDGAIKVGDNTNVQDCAVLHEETTVGSGCTIGHGAIVHGCTVGDNVLIGMGATVLNGAKIGDNCIVGAGALVTGKMDAPAGSMILGSPAKVVRPLTEAEIESNRESAREYCHQADRYREDWFAPKIGKTLKEARNFTLLSALCRLQPNRRAHILAPILNEYF